MQGTNDRCSTNPGPEENGVINVHVSVTLMIPGWTRLLYMPREDGAFIPPECQVISDLRFGFLTTTRGFVMWGDDVSYKSQYNNLSDPAPPPTQLVLHLWTLSTRELFHASHCAVL